MQRGVWTTVLTLIAVVAACGPVGQSGGAADLLPNVPHAKIVEGKTITQYISSLTEGQALLVGNPLLVAAIEFTEGAVTCYQDIGAVAVRIYSDETFPLSSGLVAIVDRNAITDLGNLARCLGGGPGVEAQAVQVCAHTYTLKKEDNEFYIAYLATTAEMCQAFCSALEGCAESKQ